MAHRQLYNTSQMFEAEPDEHWNQLHSEEQYPHFARTNAMENGLLLRSGDSVSAAEQIHYASQWNPTARPNGYPSSTLMGNPPHFQADTSDPSRGSLHQSAAPNNCMVPETHAHHSSAHHASSSNYGDESNFFDLQSNVRGARKRKSPASSSRFYCAGSSSGASSFSELRQEKPSLDSQHNLWDPLTAPPGYGPSYHSIGAESSGRNVRRRSVIDLEFGASRTHLPANYSDHPCSSRLPMDHPGTLDLSSLNTNLPLPEWTPAHALGAPHGRIMSNNLGHDSSHFFAGNSVTHVAPPSMHSIPSHTRGVRSGFIHRSSLNSRVPVGNVRMGRTVAPNESQQLAGEAHSSRHPRPFGPAGWRSGDRNGRSRLSSERYHMFSEDPSQHDHLTHEGLVMVDRSLYGSRDMLDHHRDMRLDVDNMSYEELLALGERIGSVSTGVSHEQLRMCLTETVYFSSDQTQEEGRCVICLEGYRHMDNIGTLKACGHDYHVSCIKKWLSLKNLCPICKGAAVPENINGK